MSAIIANLHDVIIILGFFAFFQWEFSPRCWRRCWRCWGYGERVGGGVRPRARDLQEERNMSTPQVLDHAITSTICTVITHGRPQVMVLSMLVFGGETLYLRSALTIGICFGIYLGAGGEPAGDVVGVSREQFIAEEEAGKAVV